MKTIQLTLYSIAGGYQVDPAQVILSLISPLDLAILEMYFSEHNGATRFVDQAAHAYRHVGDPIVAANGGAVFPGTGMLIAPVVGPLPLTTTQPPFTLVTGNDNFANRRLLTGLPARSRAENIGATGELDEPNPFTEPVRSSVWWSWTAPRDALVKITSFGSSFDTLLSVYTGNDFADLVPVDINDDDSSIENNRTSSVSFGVFPGNIYHICVEGSGGEVGQIDLSIDQLSTDFNLTEWDFISNQAPQRLTLSIDFALDSTGATLEQHQYLFDTRHRDWETSIFDVASLSVRYFYGAATDSYSDTATPADSYLAFNILGFQHDLTDPAPATFRIPLIAEPDQRYRFDLVIFTDAYTVVRAIAYLDGFYYSDTTMDWFDWRFDRFALGGTLFTNGAYPQIGNYPGYLNGRINEIFMRQGAYDVLQDFTHPLQTVLDLPLSEDWLDLAAWDYQVTPVGSVALSAGVATFTGGHLQLIADKALIPDDFDWDLELVVQAQPNQADNAVIFCRMPTPTQEHRDPRFYGSAIALIVNPPAHPGHLVLVRGVYVNKGKFSRIETNLMRSLLPINDGLPHKIRVARSNGCLDHQHDLAISGTPPDYRGSEGFNAIRLYIDDLLQADDFGRGDERLQENPDYFGTPIYFGSFPPGLVSENPLQVGGGAFNGNISKVRFRNRLPDVPRLFELELNERDGATSFLDLGGHTWANNSTNSTFVTASGKQAVFTGTNYLSSQPVDSEWQVTPGAWSFAVEWGFDSLAFASVGIFEQYVCDCRSSASSDFISVHYYRDPGNPTIAGVKVRVGGGAIEWTIQVPIELNRRYRVDVLVFERSGSTYATVAIDGAFYAYNLLYAGTISWNIVQAAIGAALLTNGTYLTPGSYPGKLLGRVNRIKWVHGVFDPFMSGSSDQSLVLDLEFESDYQDQSDYANPVTATGTVSLVNREARFTNTSGGGYLTIAANPVLDFGSSDWRLDVEVAPQNYLTQTNAPVLCRPELNTDTGRGWILTYNSQTDPGYLTFHDHFLLNTTSGQYTVGPVLLKSQAAIPVTDEIAYKISLVRTTGVYDGGSNTAIWLYIDGELHDVAFGAASAPGPDTPIYVGSVPPGSTNSVSGGTGSGKFTGRINYIRLSNHVLPIYLLTASDGRQFQTHEQAPILI